MDLKVHGDTIESLIKERRETEREAKKLQEQIDHLRNERELLSSGGSGPDTETLKVLDEQLEELSMEKKDSARKLKNICMMARTISAGD